ncbi:MAG: hypothetical protein H7145_17590 [Akkermansiaceae bacterium]|nr:hypothetical protein [Armatimonadota bacterium]
MEKKTCPECGSAKWMAKIKTLTPSNTRLYVTDETFFDGPKGISGVRAEGCGDCGYVQYYLEDPQVVYDEWRKHNA